MKIIENMEQGSSEWKSFRRDHITSTDSSIIMGLNPWVTPLQLWNKKITGEETKENYAMRRGTAMEAKAREWATEMIGVDLEPAVVVSSEHEWAMTSLDGTAPEHKVLIEIKCPGEKGMEKARNGEIPEYYKCQCQHHLMVTGYSRCHFINFDGESGVITIINRDESFIQEMIKKEMEFLYMLRDFVAPEATERDFQPRLDDSWHIASLRYIKAKDELKRAEEEVERTKNVLIELSRDTNSQGCGVKLQMIFRKGVVKYSDIPELKNVNLEKYRNKPSGYWKLTHKE